MRRRRALQAAGSLLVGGLSGCASVDRAFDTYRYEANAPVDGPVAVPWRTMAHDIRRSGYSRFGRLPAQTTAALLSYGDRSYATQPVLVGETAYFGSTELSQRDITGRVRRRGEPVSFSGAGRVATPTAVGDAIFVTGDGLTRAFDRRDGTLCWEYREGVGGRTASPTVDKETVYVTGERIFALAARTGSVRWGTNRPDLEFRGTAVTDDGVFATAGDGSSGAVYRFDVETGQQQWQTSITDDLPVSPVIDELVYVVEAAGRLRALDPTDGTEVWSYELDSSSSTLPAVAEGTVYVAGRDGDTLYALDALTGDLRWRSFFSARRAFGPTVAGDRVYLPTTREGGGGLVQTVTGDTVYFSTDRGGVVREFVTETGAIRDDHNVPMEPTAPVAIGVNIALVATRTPFGGSQLYVLS